MQHHDILAFWFGDGDPTAIIDLAETKKWFQKNPAFDNEIKHTFGGLIEQARQGHLSRWRQQSDSCLALILLLDQFTRNVYRQSADAFSADQLALNAARHAVSSSFDQEVGPIQRAFFYLPFEHAESMADQNKSVALFEALSRSDDAKPGDLFENYLDYARRHRTVIKQFGRFPHRNTILGRAATPEETAFLQRPGSSF